MLPNYEVYAIKYADHQRTASVNFLGGDPHNGPMPMDYFVWLIRDGSKVWVVDAGFNAETATARGRNLMHALPDALKLLDVDAAKVPHLLITHMHYDHVGNLDAFPNATFHLQDREMEFATGRYMTHHCFQEGFNLRDVLALVQEVYKGRVKFYDGVGHIAPGLSTHHVGGHTRGLQVVRVHTQRGWIVLASDASHYYRNMHEERPFPTVYNVGEMVEGYRKLAELADSDDHIVPGHDPEVLKRYAPPSESSRGSVATLHIAPRY